MEPFTIKAKTEVEPTPIWRKYEKGIDYLNRKRLIDRTNRNWNFFVGKQWEGLESGGEELPFFNFIHPNIMRRVTTIYSNRMAVHYTDMDGRVEMQPVYDKLQQMFSNDWEKANEDVLMRQTLKEAAITGDGIQYFGSGNMEDVQALQNTSILYGDESETNIQKQPYIIIHQRETVDSVRNQARKNGLSDEEIALIIPDQTTETVVGNRQEVNEDTTSTASKVTTLIYMCKKNGIVHVTKCTKNVVYEAEHPIATTLPNGEMGRGLTRYPVLKLSWEDFPNDARGVSQVETLVPNQIEVNKILARRSMTTKMTAFPRIAYDANMILNPQALEKVGQPIEVQTGGVQSVSQMISYLNPAQSSNEPKLLADDILEVTQELSGSGDNTMGNIDLQRVAAAAVNAVYAKAESMLDETVAKKEMFTEDMANLWVELWQVYHPEGLTVTKMETVTVPIIDPATGQPKIGPDGLPMMETKQEEVQTVITSEELDKLKPRTRIDVSKDNSFTREAKQSIMDQFLEKGYITPEEYVEIAPETSPVPRAALENVFKRRKEQAAQMPPPAEPQPPEGAMPPQGA